MFHGVSECALPASASGCPSPTAQTGPRSLALPQSSLLRGSLSATQALPAASPLAYLCPQLIPTQNSSTKYLGMNLTNEVKDLYNEKFKILMTHMEGYFVFIDWKK